jgi:hypothetical protein
MEDIWNANPTITRLFAFEDGNCFINQSDAASYKKTTGKGYSIVEKEIIEDKPTKTNKK